MNQTTGLMEGEQVKYTGKIHNIIFAAPLAFFIIGAIYALAHQELFGRFLMTIGVLLFLRALMTKGNTEIHITDKRLIIKYGIIPQHTFTSLLNKIEAVSIRRGLFGTFFNYGTITVSGTGKATTTIPHLADPNTFQSTIHEQGAF